MSDSSKDRKPEEVMAEAVSIVADKLDADVILINSMISDFVAERLSEQVSNIGTRRDNVLVVLATYGGDAHAAYVIGRTLQRSYKKVIMCIAGDCYSAGTLALLSSHEIIMGDNGKLGPLDVQLVKKDELKERLSGLTVTMALDELRDQVFETFVSFVIRMKTEFGPHISSRTAMDIAANITGDLYGEVYKQIDPVKLGDDARALGIAVHYGRRLGSSTGNLQDGTVERLLNDYPAHECIIDRLESQELFHNVREPSKEELKLLLLLGPNATHASSEWKGVAVLSKNKTNKTNGNTEENHDKRNSSSGDVEPENENKGNAQQGNQPVSSTRSSSTGRTKQTAETDSAEKS